MDDIHDLEELKIPQLDAENIIRIYAVREFLSGERQRVIEATRDGVKELIADNYSRFEEEIKVKHGLFGLRKIKLRYVEFFGKRDDSFNTFLCDEGSEIFDALLPDDVKEICGQVELYANISSVLRKVESLNKILCPKECSDKCSDCLPERQLKTTPETVEYYIAELAKEVVAYNENIGNISQIFDRLDVSYEHRDEQFIEKSKDLERFLKECNSQFVNIQEHKDKDDLLDYALTLYKFINDSNNMIRAAYYSQYENFASIKTSVEYLSSFNVYFSYVRLESLGEAVLKDSEYRKQYRMLGNLGYQNYFIKRA